MVAVEHSVQVLNAKGQPTISATAVTSFDFDAERGVLRFRCAGCARLQPDEERWPHVWEARYGIRVQRMGLAVVRPFLTD